VRAGACVGQRAVLPGRTAQGLCPGQRAGVSRAHAPGDAQRVVRPGGDGTGGIFKVLNAIIELYNH